MASIIRIKRSTGILAPSTLKTAELAYAYGTGTQSNGGDRLFIGTGDNGAGGATAIKVIGGSYFTDMLDHVSGTLTASSAIVVDADKKIDQLLSGDIVIDGATNKISGLADPTDSSGVATKRYVDNLNKLQGILFTGDSGSDSVNLSDSGLNFQGQAGEINTKITNNNLLISLDSSGVVAGTYGSTTAVPIITVDDFGRIDSVGTAPASVTLNISADSGLADSVNLLSDVFKLSGSNSIITKVVDSGIDIRLDSTHQVTHLASKGASHPGLYTYGGGTSNARISVDDFGIVKHIDQTNNVAELTIKDDITGNSPTEHKLFTEQNDLVIKGGSGIKVTMTGPTHSTLGVADYTDGLFEISVDSGGTVVAEIVEADSGTYGTLKADSARFDAIYSRTGNSITIAPNTDSGGDIVLGTRYGYGIAQGNHKLDLNNVGIKQGSINPETVGGVSFGGWGNPFGTMNLWYDLRFRGGQSHIDILNNADSALTITARTPLPNSNQVADMMRFNTKDSQIHVEVDQRMPKDKFIYFGDSPAHALIGKESIDNWMILSNNGTGISLTSTNIQLNSTANAGFKVIGVKGSIKPQYSPGELFDIGDSLGLVPATNYYTFKDGYFSGTLHANNIQTTSGGLSADSAKFDKLSSKSGHGIDVVDSVIFYNNENLVFGNGYTWNGNPVPGRTTMRHDTTDHYFEMLADSHTTAAEFAAKNITLIAYDPAYDFRSGFGGLSGVGNIELDGNVIPALGRGSSLYNQGYRRNLGTATTRFGTVYAGHFNRPQVVDSAVYGSQTAIPVLTINTSGLIDSVGTVPLATTLNIGADAGTGDVALLDSSIQVAGGFNVNTRVEDNVVTVHLDSDVLGLTSLTVDNVKIDGNTISSTDSSNQLFIDPFPVGDSGDLVVRGNLIVQGTETVVNSSVVSLNDKNLVLADSAANSSVADGAGITVGGAQYSGTKPKFVFDAATDRWDPNLPLDIPFASLDSAVFLNGVALREVVEDHLDNFFGVDSNAALTLTYDDVQNSMTWKAINATKSQVGVSSFDSANFSVTAGHVAVTVLDGGTY